MFNRVIELARVLEATDSILLLHTEFQLSIQSKELPSFQLNISNMWECDTLLNTVKLVLTLDFSS